MSANSETGDRWTSSKEWIKDVLSKSGTDLMEIQKPKGNATLNNSTNP